MESELMWFYGFHPVREVLRGRPGAVQRVQVARAGADQRTQEIVELCEAHGIAVERVETAEISSRFDGVHNGLAAELSALELGDTELDDGELDDRGGGDGEGRSRGGVVDADAGPAIGHRLVVLVEDVQDPRNLGALIRVCDAVGVDQVLVRDRGSSQFTASVVKTSAGAAEWAPLERVTNSANEIDRLQKDGYWVYGAAEGGAAPWDLDLSGKVVLCIGGEEKGLRHRTRELCDELVGLPMAGRVESLNLATAAAAILYEIVRQRDAASNN